MADADPISPVTTRNPEFEITSASLNSVPVELDGKPASPSKVAEIQAAPHPQQLSEEDVKRREQLHSARQGDPAVLVDIPQTPGADELAKAGGILEEAESQVTPISS